MLFVLDIGGTQIKAGLVDDQLHLVERFPALPSPKSLADFEAVVDQLLQPYLPQVAGVAMSAPGTVDTRTDTIYFGGMLPYLDGFEVATFFKDRYGLPAHVINDGKAAVLAEVAQGSLQGVKNGLALVLGTGLGGGLIINGQLYQGSHFQAGELTFLVPDKPEPDVSEMTGVKLSAVGLIKRLADCLGLEDADGKQVFEAISQHDERVYSDFEAYCRQVALTILNLQTILDVERVAIGGGISSQPILLEEINRQFDLVKALVPPIATIIKRPGIVACTQGNAANLLGAAYHFYQQSDC